MSANVTVSRLKSHLADLSMPGTLEVVDGLIEKLDWGSLSAAEAMEQLISAQVVLKRERRLSIAMRSSRLPTVKKLDSFDFSFQPSIDRSQILSLHELTFIERKENVIFLGPAGVGKTHLAISLTTVRALLEIGAWRPRCPTVLGNLRSIGLPRSDCGRYSNTLFKIQGRTNFMACLA